MTMESIGTAKSLSSVKGQTCHTFSSVFTKKGKLLTDQYTAIMLCPVMLLMYMYDKLTVTPLPPTILPQVGYILLLHVSLYPP